jgi:phenylalanyl-tRNA synthetase beta chain
MKIPLSWLKDFINLDGLSIEYLARRLTLAGLEVEEIKYVGLPTPERTSQDLLSSDRYDFKTSGIAWDKEKIVVAEIYAVDLHPNADRLVLCDLFDGRGRHTILTGAPNLFEYKGKGKLPKPIKVAYAKEGAMLYDGHAAGWQLMTLKRTKIRGVDSYSMACSEKELGISDDHEGIILLADEAPVGTALADYMGDAVFDIAILPNMARNASVIGVARELSALTGRALRKPAIKYKTAGDPIKKLVSIEISEPEFNPRFVLGLIREVEIRPSPYEIQRRLKLAGMRPINCIVDATNYAMLELGEPLHAFDYDVLKERAGRKAIKIITRVAKAGEKLTTLDGVSRTLTSMNVLVCDRNGPLSIAGVMGGAESEVYDASREVLDPKGTEIEKEPPDNLPHGKASIRSQSTTNVLLEGAAWNFINIRRTANEHNLISEASFRFSRGVHPALAEMGVKRGLQLMAEWSGGKVAPGLVDEYPLKPRDPTITLTPRDVKRLLGIELSAREIVDLLEPLEFKCKIKAPKINGRKSKPPMTASRIVNHETQISVTVPPHRLDIGTGTAGLADVLEEVARCYGYDRIPETRMADALPPQVGNPAYEWEQHVRDLLVALGLQEVVGYRLTSPESEARLLFGESPTNLEYVTIANPITPERRVLRRSLLACVLESLESNIRLSESLAMFEIGPIFEPRNNDLPDELNRLAIAMTGLRQATAWDVKSSLRLDFYDLKGRIELLLCGLHLTDVSYSVIDSVHYLHPGKAAAVKVHGAGVGVFGELHPLIQARYELGEAPVLVAEFDLQALRATSPAYGIQPVSEFPPIFEDIAVIIDESIPASKVESLIRQTAGGVVTNVRLFDLYRGEQIDPGKKSLAYHLTYQAPNKTLTDVEAAEIRNKVVRRLEQELGAKLRS